MGVLAGALAGCGGLPPLPAGTTAAGPNPASNKLVADRIKDTFSNYASYDGYEISDYRSVHSVKGWTWLTCVRFQDHGQTRTYALFIKGSAIVDSRYAVQTDGCATQSYSPFSLTSGQTSPANTGALAPLY